MQGFNYKFRIVIKGVTFFLILAMLFVIMSLVTENVLMDRDRLVPVRNKNFYRIRREKTDSIDVIIVGNSLSYSAISPMGFWREHGFTAYACGQSGQTIRETEEMLKTALSVQTPRVVILETDVLFNKNNQITRKNLDKIIGSALGYYVPVLRGHDIWKSLIIKKGYSDNSFKGFAVRPNVAAYKKGDYMSESGEKEEISETTLDYMDRIINMCEGVGAELILVGTPSPDNYNYAKHKVIEEYAREKSLISLDMNMLLEEVGIDWKTDSLDKGDHLNLSGAEKVTIYLGRFLTEKCELPDHRGDPAYKSWAEESEKYEESIAPILKEIRGANTLPEHV